MRSRQAHVMIPLGSKEVKFDINAEISPYLLYIKSTIQYSTVQYSTVQYSTVQYSTVQKLSETLRLIADCPFSVIMY